MALDRRCRSPTCAQAIEGACLRMDPPSSSASTFETGALATTCCISISDEPRWVRHQTSSGRERAPNPGRRLDGPLFSPDGTMIAFDRYCRCPGDFDCPDDTDVYVVRSDGTHVTALLPEPTMDNMSGGLGQHVRAFYQHARRTLCSVDHARRRPRRTHEAH